MALQAATLEALAPLARTLARALALGAPWGREDGPSQATVPVGPRRERWSQAVEQALGGATPGGPEAGVAALHAAYAWVVRLAIARALAGGGHPRWEPGPVARAPAAALWCWLEALGAGVPGDDAAIEGLLAPDGFRWVTSAACRTPVAEAAWRPLLLAIGGWTPPGGGDAFRALYHALIPPALRHALGEFYTPRWLVQAVLAEAPADPGWTALDPCCGSGAFLVELVAEVLAETANQSPGARLEAVLGRVRGLDVNPLAVLAAQANMVLALAPLLVARGRGPLRLPVELVAVGAEGAGGGRHDRVVGNPPWVAWRDLPEAHRAALGSLREARGLRGADRWVGGTDLNVCAVLAHLALERWVRPGGTLAFLMPRQLLHLRAAEGLRRWQLPDGERVTLVGLSDWTATRPFEAACAPLTWVVRRAATAGPAPVPLVTWRADAARAPGAEAGWDDVRPTLAACLGTAVQQGGAGGAYLLEGARAKPLAPYLGASAYRGRRATETSPHAVFWLRPVGPIAGDDATWLVETGVNPRARRVTSPQQLGVERAVLAPLLRGRDIRPFTATPGEVLLLFPHDAAHAPGPLPPEVMPPAARAYLDAHEPLLAARSSQRAYGGGKPFYGLWRVGPYTFLPWKVVWPEVGTLRAAVVGMAPTPWGEQKLVVPEGKVNFIGCSDPAEAHFLCALLNAPPLVAAYAGSTSETGRPARLPLALPRHDATRWTHRALAAVSRAAHGGRLRPERWARVLTWLAERAILRARAPATPAA
ncbi:MAG: N-6 DNA methylase [Candidatus Sericytochromatia bacterium]|nr:N-6 DNA methylase [Candidatus Sericytochromatia bacterium]